VSKRKSILQHTPFEWYAWDSISLGRVALPRTLTLALHLRWLCRVHSRRACVGYGEWVDLNNFVADWKLDAELTPQAGLHAYLPNENMVSEPAVALRTFEVVNLLLLCDRVSRSAAPWCERHGDQ
jgi:hypothetical protein